jgi:FGGY-family pentulose kinase
MGSGVIDAYAGWIGTVGASDSGPVDISEACTRLAVVAGTSTCHLALSAAPIFVHGVWGPYRDVTIPNHWMSEGGQSATGELLKHIIETHPAYAEAKKKAEDLKSPDIFSFLNSSIKSTAKRKGSPSPAFHARHFFFYGDYFGNRSPVADSNMTGSITGLSSDTSIEALSILYYCCLEFIALQTRQIIERMNLSGHNIQSIYMSGSQCRNEMLIDLMSTACNMPIVIPKYRDHAVVHGAAMLGYKAWTEKIGKPEDLWSIMNKMTKPGKKVKPSRDKLLITILEAKYKVFLEQCESQQRWRKNMDDSIKLYHRSH